MDIFAAFDYFDSFSHASAFKRWFDSRDRHNAISLATK